MRPFNLKEYLEHPDWKVVTRAGRNARIVCVDAKGDFPVIALVEKSNGAAERPIAYTKDGSNFLLSEENPFDLFFAPKKHEGWTLFVNSESIGPDILDSIIYATREEAQRMRENHPGRYGAIVKLEWEE